MLGTIEDPRKENGKQHALEFVLAVCVVAALAGAKGYSEIARRARDMTHPLLAKLGAEWDWFRGRYKYPGKGTIRLVLSGIGGNRIDDVTGNWLAEQSARGADGAWEIAVDGKVLRGAWTAENEKVTLFSAMIREEGVTIAQLRVPDGTNEITQAGALLDSLPIPGNDPVIFTLDAAHTRQETSEAIRKRPEWHYVMTVKGNQPTCSAPYSTQSSRSSGESRTTSWKTAHAVSGKHGRAGLRTRAESTSREPRRPPSSYARRSRYPATGPARKWRSCSPARTPGA